MTRIKRRSSGKRRAWFIVGIMIADLVMMALHPTDRSILIAMTAETIAMKAEAVNMTAGTVGVIGKTIDAIAKMIGIDIVAHIVVITINIVIIPLVVQLRDVLRGDEDTDLHHLVLIGVTVVSTLKVLTDTVSILEGKILPQEAVTEGIQAVAERSIAITVLIVAAVGTAHLQDTPVTRSQKE